MFRSDVGEKMLFDSLKTSEIHLDRKLSGNEYLKRRAADRKSFNILTVFVIENFAIQSLNFSFGVSIFASCCESFFAKYSSSFCKSPKPNQQGRRRGDSTAPACQNSCGSCSAWHALRRASQQLQNALRFLGWVRAVPHLPVKRSL